MSKKTTKVKAKILTANTSMVGFERGTTLGIRTGSFVKDSGSLIPETSSKSSSRKREESCDLTVETCVSENSPRPWSESAKEVASQYIETKIKEQEEKLCNIKKLIARTQSFFEARNASNNKMGAQLSMKQLQRYQSELEQSSSSLEDLVNLFFEISTSEQQFDYEKRVTEILNRPLVLSSKTGCCDQRR